MDNQIKLIAASAAVVVFFLMSILSCFVGCAPEVASIRALKGAVITYAVIWLAAKCIMTILIREIAAKKLKEETEQ